MTVWMGKISIQFRYAKSNIMCYPYMNDSHENNAGINATNNKVLLDNRWEILYEEIVYGLD